jgi:hypothetical protein
MTKYKYLITSLGYLLLTSVHANITEAHEPTSSPTQKAVEAISDVPDPNPNIRESALLWITENIALVKQNPKLRERALQELTIISESHLAKTRKEERLVKDILKNIE